MTRTTTDVQPSPSLAPGRNVFRLMQAMEDATIFRRARSMSLCIDCYQAPDGGRCDDHAVDLTLIAGYQQDLRELRDNLPT